MKRRLPTPGPPPVGTAALPAVAGGGLVPVAAWIDPAGDGAGMGLPGWGGLEMGNPWQCFWDGLPELCSPCTGAGRSCPGPSARCSCVGGCGENWLNWSPCLLLLAGSGFTTVLCPGTARASLGKTHRGSGADLGWIQQSLSQVCGSAIIP